MTVPTETGLYPGISDDVYHGDRNSLSSSGARMLLEKSPMEFFHQLNNPPAPTKVYDYGHVVHKLVLGEGAQLAVLDPAVVGLTKDGEVSPKPTSTAMWKAAEAEARAAGQLPVATGDLAKAQAMADQVRRHPIAAALFAEGVAEMSGWWVDPETGVWLRIRPDFLPVEVPGRRPLIIDYKTSDDANPYKFTKSAAKFGYHCQGDFYEQGLRAITGVAAEFVLVAQSKTPPYAVSVHYVDPEDMVRAGGQNRRAIRLYARCRETGTWPGYDELNILSLPHWLRKEIDLANAIGENTMEGEY